MKIQVDSMIMLLGSIQGFILFTYLISRKSKTSNKVLTALVFTFSLDLLLIELIDNFYQSWPHLIRTNDALTFLYGPLIYLYVSIQTGYKKAFSIKDLLHFIPFFIVLFIGVPFYALSVSSKLQFVNEVIENGMPLSITLKWIAACIQIVIYLIASIPLILNYRKSIKDNYSYTDRINLKWLMWMVTGNILIWSLDLVIILMHHFQPAISTQVLSETLGILCAIFIYGIAYNSLANPEIFTQMKVEENNIKYARSGLNEMNAQRIKDELIQYMEQHNPYLKDDLNLSMMAENLNTPSNHLSQVINQQFNQSFFDFVNKYRVEEAKEWLSDEKKSNATMLAIAFESGFKSKSTFNAAFKKHTGLTPSAFKQKIQQSSLLKRA